MLTLPLDTVGWIILKAREFDVKAADTGADDHDNSDAEVLQDRGEDPSEAELRSWIDDLTDTQSAELVALMWLGRGDGDAEDFASLVEQARGARTRKTSGYLLGVPLLSDYLSEGLEALGVDSAEVVDNCR